MPRPGTWTAADQQSLRSKRTPEQVKYVDHRLEAQTSTSPIVYDGDIDVVAVDQDRGDIHRQQSRGGLHRWRDPNIGTAEFMKKAPKGEKVIRRVFPDPYSEGPAFVLCDGDTMATLDPLPKPLYLDD